MAGLLKSTPKEVLLCHCISDLENGGHPSWMCGLGCEIVLAAAKHLEHEWCVRTLILL